MWILGTYLSCCAASLITVFTTGKILEKRMKKEGYEYTKAKERGNWLILSDISLFLIASIIPLMNLGVIVESIGLLGPSEFDDFIKESLDDGLIYKTHERINMEIEQERSKKRLEEAYNHLSEGKLGDYETFNVNQKLDFLEKIEKREEHINPFLDALTDDELKTLVYNKKEEVLQELKNPEKPKVLVKKSEM